MSTGPSDRDSGVSPPRIRRLIVVSGEHFGEVLLGPASRQLEIAQGGVIAGIETLLVGGSCSRTLPEGISFRDVSTFDLKEVVSSDALVVSAYMPGRWLFRLLRSNLSFHVDLYCVTATEILPSLDSLPDRKAWLQRRRRVLRYAAMCARAERIYVSNSLQISLLGGMFFGLQGRAAQRLAFEFPAKTIVAPMTPSANPFPMGNPNPYPSELAGRPVFLWGGGIWKWFDIDTLLGAFSILLRQNSEAALFFLSSRNPSHHSDQDAPHVLAAEKARSLGLLGRNVFFNDRKASPEDLPAYLEHCHAGILANGAHLESTASWRTRQLDLLWAGKPAVVAGEDPLSRLMADRGAAWLTGAGDSVGLAELVEKSLDDRERSMKSEAANLLAAELTQRSAARFVAKELRSEGAFHGAGSPASPSWILRYVIGI